MKTLLLGMISFVSISSYASTQIIECKGDEHQTKLTLELNNDGIGNVEFEYSGEQLISGLYRGQSTNDSNGEFGSLKIIKKKDKMIVAGQGWNPAYDDANYYAFIFPAKIIGKAQKKGSFKVQMAGDDNKYGTLERSIQLASERAELETCWSYIQR